MNCIFCNNYLITPPYSQPHEMFFAQCKLCPTDVSYYLKNNSILRCFIYDCKFPYKILYYYVLLDFECNQSTIFQCSAPLGVSKITSFNLILNVSPQNINNKIKNILTFL